MRPLASEPSERMYELLLDSRHQVCGVYLVSKGGLDGTLVDPKDVFRAALLSNAAGFILVHNHPSGDPTASAEDRAVTRQVANGRGS